MAEFLEQDDEDNVFRGLAELPASPREMRKSCKRCKLVLCPCKSSGSPSGYRKSCKSCVFRTVGEVLTPENRLLATVPLLAACLPPEKCRIYKGRRFSKNEYSHLHELVLQPNTFILYPGPSAVDIRAVAVYEHCHLIVPDGTWRQAKDIFRNNPFLHNTARQVLVDNKSVSEYVIRTQPNNKCLSTLEAISLALSVLEKNEKLHKILVSPLRALCQIQLDHGAVSHVSKEERKRIEETQSQGTVNDVQQKEEDREETPHEDDCSQEWAAMVTARVPCDVGKGVSIPANI